MIQPERVKDLGGPPCRGRYVLYWMQQAQRVAFNHALALAIDRANDLHRPVVVFFGLTDAYPGARERHYAFMLQGLAEVGRELAQRGIPLVVRACSPEAGALDLAKQACLVVMDRGYLPIQRLWRRRLAERAVCPVVQVESDVIVPVETASLKEEYAARTFRPRVGAQLDRFLVPLEQRDVAHPLGEELESLPWDDPDALLAGLAIDRTVGPVRAYRGGLTEARRRLADFLDQGLHRYEKERNDPNSNVQSGLSPYLHFGQISALEVALEALLRGGPGVEAFLEELIVRRELAVNFVHYNPHHGDLEGLPEWARRTLLDHGADGREALYTAEELAAGLTHDDYWNAAQREMIRTGKMHGYMRMYWGKRILEWTAGPAEGIRMALDLNDAYELDGRDPSGYAGVMWCFGKHDRPWGARPLFGKVRSMTAGGLRRKFDVDAYVRRVAGLKEEQ